MKLDAEVLRFLNQNEWRVLEAVELGSKNHEFVSVPLITQIAKLRRANVTTVLKQLLKHKLLCHNSQAYDGYGLTYLGYDFLALRAFRSRRMLTGVGMRMGVGKESDIHICQSSASGDPTSFDGDGSGATDGDRPVILKLHRLGRVSFRTIKRNRDYLGKRRSASWMYMARLAAAKEFAYMQTLHQSGFPVPKPIDVNRHAILMEYIDAHPMSQVNKLAHPEVVLEELMSLIVKLAEHGIIHGDFNEFNLLIDDDENITLIDFPQMVAVTHPDAKFYFERDVECVRRLFESRFGLEVTEWPKFEEIDIPSQANLDTETEVSEADLDEMDSIDA